MKKRRFKHLSWNDRLRIESFLKCGKRVQEIADEIGVHRNTIYNELKRGRYIHRNSDWTEEERYSPDIAEAAYRENLAAKGPGLKIGKDHRLAAYIERRIVEDGYSPAAVLDRLERRYGKLFSKVFQTITVDNGTEFSDVAGLERSCLHKGKRTTVFYCHPYSSYERGTNENTNGMIRRWFPKGTDFGKVTAKAIQAVEDWLNAYPRGILGFRCADDVFAEALAALV